MYPALLLSMQLSNYSSFEGVLYCKPHFDQLFKMTGSLDKSFEGDKLLCCDFSWDISSIAYIGFLNRNVGFILSFLIVI